MDILIEMRFGSHLYGTATPSSDLDLKAVYLPDGRDILLQRVRETVVFSSANSQGQKNTPDDIDREIFSLERYLSLLAEGQSMALDMLFAPDDAMLRPVPPLWRTIQVNSSRLVSRQSAAFVRYCRQQAHKYGLKGSRVASARQAVALLTTAEEKYGSLTKFGAIEDTLRELAQQSEHIGFVDLPMPDGRVTRHLELCGKKLPFENSIRNAREIAEKILADYGQRAILAERNDGADWKALSHAVRVAREAIELFREGRITLPLPYATEILAIRRGERPYAAVAEEIEALLAEVEVASAGSAMRETPDQDFIDELVAEAYRHQVEKPR